MYFEELSIIYNGADDFIHVISLVGRVGNNFIEGILDPVDGVVARYDGSLFEIVLRNETEQVADKFETVFFGVDGKMGHSRFDGMYAGTAQLFGVHIFARHGFHYGGAGEEHV